VKFLLLGLVNTLKAAAVAMAAAVVLGAALALLRLTRSAPLRWLATAWIEFFRGVPLLLLIFFSFFALPKYGIHVKPFSALVLALALYNGAMLGEIFRAGILSLDRGQSEAAYAIGLGYWQAMLLVVIPQAARRMTPAIVSQLITLLKDTSLGYVISYEELLRRSRSTGEYFKNPLQTTAFVAVLYIAVNFTLSRIAQRLEVRQRRRLGAGAITTAATEDLAVVAGPHHPAGKP
jgi:glutamate transport system permease protein